MITTLTLNPAVDSYTETERVEPEQKLRCSALQREPGGGGINVSRAIQFLGGESTAVWTRGGPFGQILAELLDGERLRHISVEIESDTRENVVVLERASERHYRFGVEGPNISEGELLRVLAALEELEASTRYLVVSGSVPHSIDGDFYIRLASWADSRGIRLILDSSGDAEARAVDRGGLFLLKPNLRELAALTGRSFDAERDVADAASRLVGSGKSSVVVVSMGAAGVIYAAEEGVGRIHAPVVPFRSKIGAGDSTVAGIVLALTRGFGLDEAIRYGVAAGSAAVMTSGTRLCRLQDVERLYASMPDR